MCGASRRSSRAQSAWNVEIHICRQSTRSKRFDTRPHLFRRFVGEGDGEDAIGIRQTLADEVCDAMRDDAGLAGARARENQQRTVRLENGGLLFGIERGEKVHSLLFYRDALRQVARLIDVAATRHRNMVRQQLKRNRHHDRRQQRRRPRHRHNVVIGRVEVLRSCGRRRLS